MDLVSQQTRLVRAKQDLAQVIADLAQRKQENALAEPPPMSDTRERARLEGEIRRAETAVDQAEARVEEKADQREWVLEELSHVEKWREWLHLECVQVSAADSFKYMEQSALQRTLEVKSRELEQLWKLAPRSLENLMLPVGRLGDAGGLQGGEGDGGEGEEGEAAGMIGLEVVM